MKCHSPLVVLALLTTWAAKAQVVTRTVYIKTATVTAANTVTTTSTRTTTLTTFQPVCTPTLPAKFGAVSPPSPLDQYTSPPNKLEARAASTTTISRTKTTTQTPTLTKTATTTARTTSCTSNCQIFALRLSFPRQNKKPLLHNKFIRLPSTGTNDTISGYDARIESATRFNVLKPFTDGLNGTLFAYLGPQEVASIPSGSLFDVSGAPVSFDRRIPRGRDALVCSIGTGVLRCAAGGLEARRFVVVERTIWLVGSGGSAGSGVPRGAVDVALVPYCFSGIGVPGVLA